jgi:hypothetical protein
MQHSVTKTIIQRTPNAFVLGTVKDSEEENTMILKTAQGNPLPAAVTLNSDSDGLVLYSYDDDGTPIQAYWILTPCGGQNVNPKGNVFYGARNSSMFNGSLDGIETIPTVTTGPTYSVHYRQPSIPITIDGPIYCTLVAVPVNGGASRQIMITVLSSTGIF